MSYLPKVTSDQIKAYSEEVLKEAKTDPFKAIREFAVNSIELFVLTNILTNVPEMKSKGPSGTLTIVAYIMNLVNRQLESNAAKGEAESSILYGVGYRLKKLIEAGGEVTCSFAHSKRLYRVCTSLPNANAVSPNKEGDAVHLLDYSPHFEVAIYDAFVKFSMASKKPINLNKEV